MSFDVYGMCNPLYDIQAELTDEMLAQTGFEKGGMNLIDEDAQKALLARISGNIVNAESGGSGANTMIGVALLGGTACYTGKLADDEHGMLYAGKLREKGVQLFASPGVGRTGTCVVLITPDAERTLCTYLGVCRDLGPEDVDAAALIASQYLYVTGYLWDTESQTARSNGVKVALSLSDPFCVNRHKAAFLDIASDFVDLLIGNHEEMQELTGTVCPEDAIRATSELCDMSAVTVGSSGSLLRDGDTIYAVSPFAVDAVDTTGAGDTYAAGLLYGLTRGIPLDQTGRIAGYLAAQVVGKLGPRLEHVNHTIIAGL